MAEKTNFNALPSCTTCAFFDTVTNIAQGRTVHICHFKPPVPFAAMGMTQQGPAWMNGTFWPEVTASDWCGEHKARLAS
jgi:hypothetical protein